MKGKVLFCKRGIYAEDSLIRAWNQLGYEVVIYNKKEKELDYDLTCKNEMERVLSNDSHQYVFSINYLPVVSRICQEFDIPYLSWVVDSPELTLFSKTLENSCNYVFLFDADMANKFALRNHGHIFYMPVGADVKIEDEVSILASENYRTDISFVGSLYTEKSKYRNCGMDKKLPSYFRGFCNGLIEAQLRVYGYNFLDEVIVEEIAQEFKKYADLKETSEEYVDATKEIVANDILGLRCSELERVRLLNRLAKEFAVDIYTNSNHADIPEGKFNTWTSYDDSVTQIFRHSKINLNITSKSIKTGIPQKVFDILGAGGFLITNYQAELPEYFDIEKELVVYESEEDLVQKIRYYLEHEDERIEIAKNGYEKVKNEYCWVHRLQDILAIMEAL